MRLSRLTLERYGPFERLVLPFDPAPGRINLIVAPNGFGKSVIRGAIGDLLFGIPERTPMGFQHGTDRMRLLAEIDGGPSVVRRKGRGNTLALADGAAMAPEAWQRELGGADEAVFRELFGLDTALLRAGGAELIRSQGRLGQVLFAAGGGLGRVRELLARLEAKRDELGRVSRHKSRPIWAAMDAWQQASADLRRVALRPEGWARLETDARAAVEALQTLLAEQQSHAAERERLSRIGAVRPWLARLQEAERRLAEAVDVPVLEASFDTRWRTALERAAIATRLAATAETALIAAREARVALSFDPAWIDAAEAIEALGEQRGLAVGAQKDLPGLQAALAEAQARAHGLRRDLGWDGAVLTPATPALRAAQLHLRAHATCRAEVASAEMALAEAEAALAELTRDYAALPADSDVAVLADLIRVLRKDGDPAARLEAGRRKLRTAEAAFTKALAGIPALRADASLPVTVAPADATLDAAEQDLVRAETAAGQARREHETRRGAIADAQTRLAALERTALLPPQGALAEQRAERDRLWAAFMVLKQPDSAQAVTLDRAIHAADVVADALIAHGREAAEAASLRDQIDGLTHALARDAAAVAAAGEMLDAAGLALQSIALAAGAGPGLQGAPALRAFLRARAEAVARLGERNAAAAELADIEAWLDRLGGMLAAAMDMPVSPADAIGVLLAAADRRVEAAQTLAARRAELGRRLAEAERGRAMRLDQAMRARQSVVDWTAQWRPLAQAVSRPPEEAVDAAMAALATVEALRTTEAEITGQARRVTEMQAAMAGLATQVARLAALSPVVAELDPIAAAAALQRLGMAEREKAVRCQDAERLLQTALQTAEQSRMEAEAAARALDGLRAALRVADDDAAERQLLLVAETARARESGAEALRNLSELGGGQPVEALRERAAATTAEADTTRLQAIAASQAELSDAIETAREHRARTAAALEHASAGTEAADAAQRRQSAQAALARSAEEALMLHAAQVLLQAGLDRQAARVDQPLLARIGAVFRDITGGGQAGVTIVESKAGQKVMEALEGDGIARKSLGQLSEGTADQLYLALRIAALEDYAATTSPLPFVADDVLQTSDDTRTLAALRALLGLSAQVQVIALTHHPHVAALGAALPEGALHIIEPVLG